MCVCVVVVVGFYERDFFYVSSTFSFVSVFTGKSPAGTAQSPEFDVLETTQVLFFLMFFFTGFRDIANTHYHRFHNKMNLKKTDRFLQNGFYCVVRRFFWKFLFFFFLKMEFQLATVMEGVECLFFGSTFISFFFKFVFDILFFFVGRPPSTAGQWWDAEKKNTHTFSTDVLLRSIKRGTTTRRPPSFLFFKFFFGFFFKFWRPGVGGGVRSVSFFFK